MTNSQKIFCFAPLLDIRRWGVPTACSLYHIIIYYQACSLCEGQYPLNLWVKILLHIHPPKKRVLKRIVNDCSKSENMKVSISRKNISDSLIRPLSSSLSYASFGCSYACTHTHTQGMQTIQACCLQGAVPSWHSGLCWLLLLLSAHPCFYFIVSILRILCWVFLGHFVHNIARGKKWTSFTFNIETVLNLEKSWEANTENFSQLLQPPPPCYRHSSNSSQRASLWYWHIKPRIRIKSY